MARGKILPQPRLTQQYCGNVALSLTQCPSIACANEMFGDMEEETY